MSKFSGPSGAAAKRSPLQTTPSAPTTRTYEGAPAWALNEKSELFTLAVTNMVSEDKFYESAAKGDSRFVKLIQSVSTFDPHWVASFVPYLRNEAQMRSASIVVAAEYVRARHLAGDNWPSNAPVAADVVASACSRADEPAELLGYWLSRYPNEKLPRSLLNGMAKAAQRLYNEYSALKYDKAPPALGFGNVIELAHPKPLSPQQSELFKWIVARHHNGTDAAAPSEELTMVTSNLTLRAIDKDLRREILLDTGPDLLSNAGVTWEFLSSWLPPNADGVVLDASAWQQMIPSMGYMALLRNLRNFDQAGISASAAQYVKAKLVDPEQVEKSRQFPYRFWSAMKNMTSHTYSDALDQAIELSTSNIPMFEDGTLILIDVSGSMTLPPSGKSTVSFLEIASVMGASLAKRCPNVTIVPFATYSTALKEINSNWSILKIVEKLYEVAQTGKLEHGTRMFEAVRDHYNGEKRVFIFSDIQTSMAGHYTNRITDVPFLHFWDLAGYGKVPMEVGSNGRFLYAGFTDKMMSTAHLLETVGHSNWPFEVSR